MTAYIDLQEGDRMFTVLRGVDPLKPETIKIGAPRPGRIRRSHRRRCSIPFWRVIEEGN